MNIDNIACVADYSPKAQEAYAKLNEKCRFSDDLQNSDAIIALGGDGFMLNTLHEFIDYKIPVYGVNCGSVGFLLNEFNEENLIESVLNSKRVDLFPLRMNVVDSGGNKHSALAINEVSLLRETRQTAKLKISIDGNVRMDEMICDGILLSTPAGSTAYNLSVNGPIIPLKAGVFALTPISPFRPRRWKGALVDHKSLVKIDILNPKKRPVSAVADFTEIRDVISVEITEDRSRSISILFDRSYSLEDRILSEQFSY